MSNLTSELSRRADEAEAKLADLQSKLKQLADSSNLSDEKSQGSSGKVKKAEGVELYYWGLKNRGNYARLILAEAGVSFKDITDGGLVSKRCRCKGAMEATNNPFEPFAPPFIFHNGRMISQTQAIILYLAELTGLRPKSNFDVAAGVMVAGNVFDAFSELTTAGNKSVDALKTYLNDRFEHFMIILSKPLKNETSYYFDDCLTFVDLVVVNMLDAFHEIFPQNVYDTFITNKHSNLESLYQRIRHRANIKRLLDTQEKEGIVWCPDTFYGGIKKNLKTLGAQLEKEEQKPVVA